MSTSKPLMYAELLPNIRQISVIAALQEPSNSTTKAELSSDGTRITLHHNGEDNILHLPGQVVSQTQIQSFPPGSKELSWRLPVVGAFQRADADNAQSIEAPWSAQTLEAGARFSCRKCGFAVVVEGRIKEWRDLPSENWAEMMDFWHCHKPSDHGNHNHTNGENTDLASAKGYGANTRFTAQEGIGFVDLTSFLLAEDDCTSISQDETTVCTSCNAILGFPDPNNEGVRLLKWTLEYQSSTASPGSDPLNPESRPSMSSIISAQILAMMSSSCVSRLILTPRPMTSSSASHYLSIWVLGASLRYTSAQSRPRPKAGISAMKILHQSVSSAQAHELAESTSVEELLLPNDTISEIRSILEESGKHLPPSARALQQWNVGLLERYEV